MWSDFFYPPLTPQSTRQVPRQPRYKVVGGFAMSVEKATAWAMRCPGPLFPFEQLEEKIAQYGAEFMMIGETDEEFEWVIITQRAPFNGYRGMDSSLIPQFKEGSREEYARQLLEKEGFSESDYEFKTVLC